MPSAAARSASVFRSIAEELRQYVRGLTKRGGQGAQLKLLASTKLAALTRQAGFDPGEAELAACCEIPQPFLDRERHYRNVYRFNTDRKAHEDVHRARVRRSRDGLMPMDLVVADIHPIDIYCTREDGSLATPRGIAWLDLATNRVFMGVVLLDKGEGITNAHVIGSFVRMVQEWGCPRALYLRQRLRIQLDGLCRRRPQADRPAGTHLYRPYRALGGAPLHIVQSLPYNAPAKPIEGIFKVLEHGYFRHIPGWVGGEPLRQAIALASSTGGMILAARLNST